MFSDLLLSGSFRQYAVCFIANLNLLSTGLGQGWVSPVLLKLRNETNPVLYRPVTETEGSWIASISFLGSILSNCFLILIIDRIGRKNTIITGVIPRIISCLILLFADQIWMVILAMFLRGTSDGLLYGTVPIYATEIASKEIRGSLGVIFTIFLTTGLVIMLCIGPFMEYLQLNIILLSITVAAAIPLVFLPESPYMLFKTGNKKACLKSLAFFRASKAAAEKEMLAYESPTEEKNIDLKVILRSRTFLKALVYVVFLSIGAQVVGGSAVQFYMQTILEASQTNIPSRVASVIVGLFQLFCCITTAFTTDRFGRKPILTVCLVGEFVGLMSLGTYFYFYDAGVSINGVWNAVPLVSMILMLGFKSAGLGSILLPMYSEMFVGRSRPIGVFCALMCTKIFAFLMTRYIANMMNTFGAASTFWIFALNCVIVCFFIIFFVPETKGRSIEEIQSDLSKKKNVLM